MVVEDSTAFVEQLDVLIDSKKADKLRRRVARARIEVLELLAEVRLATRILRDMEPSEHPGGASEIQALGAHINARRVELGRRRERLKRFEEKFREAEARRRTVVIFRLHSSGHYVDLSPPRYAQMSSAQRAAPTMVLRTKGRQWWWYRDRFWWDDAKLNAQGVESAILDTDLTGSLQRYLLEEARERAFGMAGSAMAIESIPESVRLGVWRRDLGRCVDCGSVENVHFDHVATVSGDVPSSHDIELRCRTCSALRTQPGAGAIARDLAE
jgi:hypothetical protein